MEKKVNDESLVSVPLGHVNGGISVVSVLGLGRRMLKWFGRKNKIKVVRGDYEPIFSKDEKGEYSVGYGYATCDDKPDEVIITLHKSYNLLTLNK